MAINNWWDGDPAEHYWMEITGRPDLGSDLKAPKSDPSGRANWSYSLLTYVQPGDRVFHWHTSLLGEPAIVGWSEAAGPLNTISMSWQARGTRGRARGVPTTGPAWHLALQNFTRLDRPITRSVVNGQRLKILEIQHELAALVGKPVYGPFQDYGHRELRANQAYLVKFPAALVDLLFVPPANPARTTSPSERSKTARIGHTQGFLADAAVRTALELHAVRLANDHYSSAGAAEIEVLGKPFDLRVVLNGEERHVEVKASMGVDIEAVQVTQGEVDHARKWQPTDLFVVDGVRVTKAGNGEIVTSGGRIRLWSSWVPEDQALRPTQLRYTLRR